MDIKQFRRSQPFLYSIVMTLFVLTCMIALGAFIVWCVDHAGVAIACFSVLGLWLLIYNIVLAENINDDKRDDDPYGYRPWDEIEEE